MSVLPYPGSGGGAVADGMLRRYGFRGIPGAVADSRRDNTDRRGKLPGNAGVLSDQEPEEQSAEPERPDVPLTSGEGQEGFPQTDEESVQPDAPTESSIAEDGSYTTKEDVALYIHTYGKLPQNFITKKQARELGWGGGSLEPYAPGMCIGGDRFGNYEGLLPEGHSYTECDVNTLGASSRGAERIIFSSDGLIYYTGDHYASFTLLYGEE